MTTKAIARLESIKLLIKELEAEAKLLEPTVTKTLEGRAEGQVRTERGLFYFTNRVTYKNSDKVKEKEAKVKELKKKEEEDGTAEGVEKQSLSYRASKPE